MKIINKLAGLSKYSPVICFLALEVFALIAFSLGNSFVLFAALTTLLAILLVIFSIKEIKKDGLVKTAILFLPMLVCSLFIAVGDFTRMHLSVGDFNLAEVIFIPFGLLSIIACGYLLSLHKEFKIRNFLTVTFAALSILVLINLIINMINFGPCYSIIYKNYYMYYAGKRSSVRVSEIAYALEGFKFIEVQMSHYTLYPILLLSSTVVLMNLKWKESKPLFLAYITFGLIAILALVLVPSWIGLIYALILLFIECLIMILKKWKFNHKPLAIVLYCVIGLIGTLVILMIVNNQSFAGNFQQFIANNEFLNKLFNTNQYVQKYNPLMQDIFCSERFLGFWDIPLSKFYSETAHLSNSIIFDNFMTSGVLGLAIFIFVFVMGFRSFKYYKVSEDKPYCEKAGLIAFTSIFVIYSLMNADGEYAIFHNVIKPTYLTAPFILVLFMLTYVYSCGKKDKKMEVVENEI